MVLACGLEGLHFVEGVWDMKEYEPRNFFLFESGPERPMPHEEHAATCPYARKPPVKKIQRVQASLHEDPTYIGRKDFLQIICACENHVWFVFGLEEKDEIL